MKRIALVAAFFCLSACSKADSGASFDTSGAMMGDTAMTEVGDLPKIPDTAKAGPARDTTRDSLRKE